MCDMRNRVRFRIGGEISGEAELSAENLKNTGGITPKRHLSIPTSLPPGISKLVGMAQAGSS